MGAPIVLGVDASGLRVLARDVNRIGNIALHSSFRKGLLAAGEVVAEAARTNAGAWSSRIPGSIRTGATTKGVYVRAGGRSAPHAVTFEGKVGGGNRRHPVFARGAREGWRWAEQEARPFLVPALEANLDRVAVVCATAIEKAFTENGFRA